MGSTAVQLCATAFQDANMDQDLTSFATTQAFPYNISLKLIQKVVKEMNRLGAYWSMETTSTLTYSGGVYQWTMSSLSPAVNPKHIKSVWLEATNYWGELKAYNWFAFKEKYRKAAVATTTPTAWSKYGDTLELNTIPDQDYTAKVYHYRNIPTPTLTSSTFGSWPVDDEDVIEAGIFAYLLQAIGRADWEEAYQLFIGRANNLLADMKQDYSKPAQMPSNF